MNLKGYIFSRVFRCERAPQHVQNIVLRDYSKKNNINLLLSATEYTLENSYYILNQLISELKKYNGILFYSLLQLPLNKSSRLSIYKKVLEKNKQLHFAVENIVLKSNQDVEKIEELLCLKDLSLNDQNKKKGEQLNLITPYHKKTKRDPLARMIDDKVHCMKISKKYENKYWDGDRKYGYGGYKYIKDYWKPLALSLIKKYKLTNKSKILDIGCGKGFLLYEIKKILPYINIFGFDISKYALNNSPKLIKKNLFYYDARKKLKFNNNYFDLAISINTFHNFKIFELALSLKEMQRVSSSHYLVVESYRNDQELFNLQCWALTANSFFSKKEWLWIYNKFGYYGDYEFIYI